MLVCKPGSQLRVASGLLLMFMPPAGYGKVYKGRWNGAIVAVKVAEHRVAAGTDGSLSREPLLW